MGGRQDQQGGTGRAEVGQAGAEGRREDRLKAALKANIARRKAQARARASEAGTAEAGDAGQAGNATDRAPGD